jgi:lysophospholipase L1-like esterase
LFRLHATTGKKLLLSLSVAVVTGLLGLTIWEVVLRVRYHRWHEAYDNEGWFGRLTVPSDDPVLLWEYKPYGATSDMWGPIVTNRFGFRERDLATPEKPPGTIRIAFVGDSVTLGMFVKGQDIFVRRLEAIIHQELGRPGVEVLNFSVDGYDATQVREMLVRKVTPFAPDLVVYALCLNDFDHEISSGDKSRYFEQPRLFVWKAIADAVVALRVRSAGYHEHVFAAHQERVYDEIRTMRRAVEAARGRFMVAILPLFPIKSKEPLLGGEPTGTMRAYPASWRAIARQVGEHLAGEGVPFVDLYPPFADVDDPTSVAIDIWHPHARGHELIAHHLYRYLVEHQALQ